MHIPRKAGQQIEVDWAGDPAKIIDPDTGEITEQKSPLTNRVRFTQRVSGHKINPSRISQLYIDVL